MKAIVIGAGVAGLGAAVRLSALGFETDVYEAAEEPGGKLRQASQDGYRFDLGPSLFTLPENVDELLSLVPPENRPAFSYRRMDVITHYFYPDGASFEAPADPEAFSKVFSETFGEDEQRVRAYLRNSGMIYETTAPFFLHNSLHKLRTFLTPKLPRALARLPFLGISSSMHARNAQWFKDPRAAQFFDRYATYNGSDPYQAPATLNLIPHLEFNRGVYFPEGGMHRITEALYEAALALGAKFHFGAKAEKIETVNGAATGVQISGEAERGDVVVCNMDVFNAYRSLLKHERAPERILRQERSSSALIFYWGIGKEFPKLGLHNIFFSKDYKAEFADIFQRERLPKDPTIYVNITSKCRTEDAPPGKENWFAMINAPREAGQNWVEMIPEARAGALRKLSEMTGTEIEPLIETEMQLTPELIASRTLSHSGALYGASSNSRTAAFLRHPNFSSRIKNLYFCGGSAHPGGGIPLCLFSAKIVADLVARKFNRKYPHYA